MLLVSACLCGCNCTYRGDDNSYPYFVQLYKQGQVVPVCPEKLGGLPIPRLPAEIIGGDGHSVLQGQAQVLNCAGQDVTSCFVKGACAALKLARQVGATRAVFKARSPSCGVQYIYDGTFSGRLCSGDGVAAALLRDNGIEVITDEEYLNNKFEVKNEE
ncbi:MAG: DUF523 domain-containing protein [Syntrophomonadaceae bacterium]|jgi:uncharacterized protein YbbK (DUF523 family)|nr:DUF523 domain-containing protein [Syntrophomonadaceae bacterium]